MGEIADALRRNQASDRTAPTPPPAEPVDRQIGSRTSSLTPIVPDPVSPAKPRTRRSLAASIAGDEGTEWRAVRSTVTDPSAELSQQYRRLALRIRELAEARKARSIVVTSAQVGDGKTTTSCNLAIQLARLDQSARVILVDLDLRRPSVAAAFDISVDVSVDEVLEGKHPLDEAIIESEMAGFSLLANRRPAVDPERLLTRSNLRSMIRELETRYDFVLLDSPPVLATSDAQVILRDAAAAIFVVRAGHTPVRSVQNALEQLPTKKLIGTILNGSRHAMDTSGYGYYSHLPIGDVVDEKPATGRKVESSGPRHD